MKNLHYIFVMMLVSSITAHGQSCSDFPLKKGTVITLKREITPMQKKDATYFRMKKKEQDAADEQYKADIAAGKISPNVDNIVCTLEDIQTNDGVTTFYYSNLIKGIPYKTRQLCTPTQMIYPPYEDVSVMATRTRDGDTMFTTTINGYNKIPLKLNVGDTLASYQNLGINSPLRFTTTGWVSHTVKDIYGDTWKISYLRTQHIDISSSSVVKYVNREVVGEEDMMIMGKSYRAYQIYYETWTKMSMKADASSLGLTLGFAVVNKAIGKRVNKALGTNKEGYLVTSATDWFVPALGVIARSELYDSNGNLFVRSTLEDIK